ncbi:MAG: hypothetical protein J0L75_14625 [Spirochaetes bacterium]|nr:hypothetical protein [Spirochaetota bacterium]
MRIASPPRALLAVSSILLVLALAFLYLDPVRRVRSSLESRTKLVVWMDASLSMRPHTKALESFIRGARALKHLDVSVIPFSPDPGVALDDVGRLGELLRAGSSEAWAVERLIRLANPQTVHVVLSDFLWKDLPEFTAPEGRLFFAALPATPCPRTVELGDPGRGLPLLAGETNLVMLKLVWREGPPQAAVKVRWGRFDGTHPNAAGAKQGGTLRLGFENPSLMESRGIPFVPDQPGLWWMEAVLEGRPAPPAATSPGENAENLSDFRVFAVESRRLAVDGVIFSPDYLAQDFMDDLATWGAVDLKRHALLRPGDGKVQADRFAALPLREDALLLLFGPPASVVRAAAARGKPWAWFPMGDAEAARTVLGNAAARPVSGAQWSEKAEWRGTPMDLTGDEAVDGETWRGAVPPKVLVEAPVRAGDRTWLRAAGQSAFFQRDKFTFVGMHPLPRSSADAGRRFARSLALTARRLGSATAWPENPSPDLGERLWPPAGQKDPKEEIIPFMGRQCGFVKTQGPAGAPWLLALRIPLAERGGSPAVLPAMADAAEVLRRLERFNHPVADKTVERRLPLAGLWLLPVVLVLFLAFTWARRAGRRESP